MSDVESEASERERLADIISCASVDPQAFRRDCTDLAAMILEAGYQRRDGLAGEDDAVLGKLAARRLNEATYSNHLLSRELRSALATLSGWLDVLADLPADGRPRAAAFARALLGVDTETTSSAAIAERKTG